MLKKQLMEANTKLRIVETENEKLKAALKSPRPSPHLVLNSNGKPANAGFFRPLVSPQVTRKSATEFMASPSTFNFHLNTSNGSRRTFAGLF